MDSLTQFVLGASVAGVAMGDRTRPWRAVVAGGVVATLPDLDVLIEHGDAVRNMTGHRAESHALFWMTLASPLLAWGIGLLFRERQRFGRWWLAVWLALVTHALLDAMTIYGTRLGLPFTDHPFAVGSLFVIDPLYTLPLVVGTVLLLRWPGPRGRRWNRLGLVLSTVYALWSLVAQQLATAAARTALAARGITATRLVVTPAPLQTLLWRIVAVTDEYAYEGFWSVGDGARPIEFLTIERGREWRELLRGTSAVERLSSFTGDCTKFERQGDTVRITDLRMGQEPWYVFSFVIATMDADGRWQPVPAPVRSGARIDVGRALLWVWARIQDAEVPTPR